MVSLAVSSCRLPHMEPSVGEDILRGRGLWYPDIPHPSLCLNSDSFLPLKFYTDGYKPLVWTSFGGSGGIYLQHLTQVSVVCDSSMRRIEFSYGQDALISHCTLGRHIPSTYAKVINFPVDGPGGETINKVVVYPVDYRDQDSESNWIADEWALVSFEVSTLVQCRNLLRETAQC